MITADSYLSTLSVCSARELADRLRLLIAACGVKDCELLHAYPNYEYTIFHRGHPASLVRLNRLAILGLIAALYIAESRDAESFWQEVQS